jgi:tetraacyldisaccharide 4'-kinase
VNLETIPSWLLWPLTIPYGAATRLRAALYRAGILRPKRLEGVVISVGNLTVGGTGKTPMALWIAERLASEGKRAAILTRGYKGDSAGENRSDEVQLMRARLGDRVEVGVGANRFATGRDLVKRGVELFVLDDGFQHMQLARDVNIVLVDATNPFGGRLLPAGRRREPRSALGRADIVVIMRSSHAPAVEAAIRRDSQAPIFYARPELTAIHRLNSEMRAETNAALNAEGVGAQATDERATVVETAAIRARKLFAFCGIGNPVAFLADLQRWNFQVADRKFYRDHHRYTQGEFDALAQEARAAGADALICTEKDAFNLAGVRTDAIDVFYCVISLCVERGDDFWRSVTALAQQQASRGAPRATEVNK